MLTDYSHFKQGRKSFPNTIVHIQLIVYFFSFVNGGGVSLLKFKNLRPPRIPTTYSQRIVTGEKKYLRDIILPSNCRRREIIVVVNHSYEEHIEEPVDLFGYMKGSVTINGDILGPIDENWFAEI